MKHTLWPMDELVTADPEGYITAPEDAEEDVFTLSGKEVEEDGVE